MTHLSQQQLNTLDALLDEQEQAVRADIHTHTERLRRSSEPEAVDEVGDLADQADVELERDHENAAVARELHVLRDIEAARARRANGQAGVCIDCEEPIPFERLKARPAAARCVPCQERHEQLSALAPPSPGPS